MPAGALSETSARAEIQLAADPRPWTPRAATSAPTELVTATNAEPTATRTQPGDEQLAAPEGIRRPPERQREQRDRDGVRRERQAHRLVAGPGARLDLGQQRGDEPEQGGIDRDRPDRDRGDRPATARWLRLDAHSPELCARAMESLASLPTIRLRGSRATQHQRAIAGEAA